LFSWGKARTYVLAPVAPTGLGHPEMQDALVPKQIAKLDCRVGRCRDLPVSLAAAFAMVTHDRLGEGSAFHGLLPEILERILAEFARVWLPGQAGRVPQIVRLQGGGLTCERQL